jgi:ABC-type multidrug transport system ATPase subunit/CRP-like cAMP-binding protein
MGFSLQEQAKQRTFLLNHQILAKIPREAFEVLLQKGDFLYLDEPQIAFSSEELSEHLYFLLDGRLGLYSSEKKAYITILKDNEDFFGGQYFQPYQIVAISPTATLFKISFSNLSSFLHEYPAVKAHFANCFLPLGAYQFFKLFQIAMVHSIPIDLLEAFRLEIFEKDEIIVKKGALSDKFYLISYGTARVSLSEVFAQEEIVKTLEDGDFFGEVGLLESSERHATILASCQMSLYSLDKLSFERLMQTPEGQIIQRYLAEQTKMYAFKESNIIGSASDCDPRILDHNIALYHVKLSKIKERSGKFKYSVKPVCDTRKYHIFINKQPIEHEVILDKYDELIIGNYKIIIDPDRDQISVKKANDHSLQVSNLKYKHKQLTIIDNVSFSAQSGQLIGLLGPSGSGKSTFLDLLYGFKNPSSGSIAYDQTPFRLNQIYYHDIFGFVPQDDILFPELTVYENLYFAAKVRSPIEEREKIDNRIEQVLEILKLSDKKNARVGNVEKKGLSGGQKKRVNIARELLFEPDVLFLDEPTSGLSSRDAEEVVHFLRILADTGKMVITVVHQPSSHIYKMFDQIVLLEEGGKLVFSGPAKDCLAYMAAFEPEDDFPVECPQCLSVQPDKIFNILGKEDANHQRIHPPEFWQREFIRQQGLEKPVTGPLNPNNQTLFKKRGLDFREHFAQFCLLLQRTFLIKSRDYINLAVQFFTPVLLALLIAFILRSSPSESVNYAPQLNTQIPVYLFVAIILAIFTGATGSAKDIVGEQSTYRREISANLQKKWYVLSKFCVQACLTGLQIAMFLAIGNGILEIKNAFWTFFPLLYLSSLFGVSLGLLLSSCLKTTEAVINFIPLILIPQIILGGAQIQYEDFNKSFFLDRHIPLVPEICHLIPARWAYEGLILAGTGPRQTALNQLHVLRDEILIKALESEDVNPADKTALEERIVALDQVSGLVDEIYPETTPSQFNNEALSALVEKGLKRYYQAEIARGFGAQELDFYMYSKAIQKPVEKVLLTPFNWAFYAPDKNFLFGSVRLQLKTIWFNGLVLLLMVMFNLITCLCCLQKRGKKV